jgi:hypothetical protein
VNPNPVPQRAFVVTFSVDEGVAAEAEVRVDVVRLEVDRVLDRTVEDNTPEQVPNPLLQPSPQYAVAEPQYPYLISKSACFDILSNVRQYSLAAARTKRTAYACEAELGTATSICAYRLSVNRCQDGKDYKIE